MRRYDLLFASLLACSLGACADNDPVEGSLDAKGRDGGAQDAAIADASTGADAADTDGASPDGSAPDGDATTEDGATNPDGSLPLEEYAVRIAPAYCDLYVGCCSEEELRGLFRTSIRNRGQCVDALMVALTSNLQSSKESGAVDFNEEAAADCLETLGTLGCERFSTEVRRNELCRGVLDPQLDNGTKCIASIECVSGLCHQGVCRQPGDEGDDCGGVDPRCNAELICQQGMCAPKLENGSKCTGGGQCVSNYCDATGFCMEAPVICDGEGPPPR